MGPEFSEVGALEDLASLEWRLGWTALIQINPRTSLTEEAFLRDRKPVRLDAVENYIRGLLSPSPEQQMRLFTQAARLDEHYSQPSFQLGKTYVSKKDYKTAADWLVRVNRADRHYFEAQFQLGLSLFHTGDYAGAEKCFATVAAETPLNEVFNNLGAAEARQGKSAQAIANFEKAVEGDESDEDYRFNLGFTQWRAAKFDVAVASLRQAVARAPEDNEATTLLGRALKKDGPRAADPRSENRERVKTTYEEAAYRQLQAELKK
jgi:tetratricopeptide (TPR) repeat protein